MQLLSKYTKKVFDIVAVSETRIMKKTFFLFNINSNNYSFEFTSTESTAGGTPLNVANHLSYKSRKDVNLYKANQLESTFIKIINSKKVILMLDVFMNLVFYLNPLLDKQRKQSGFSSRRF